MITFLFTRWADSSFITLLVYVDDILLTGYLKYDLTLVKQSLHSKFTIKDLGSVKYFFGPWSCPILWRYFDQPTSLHFGHSWGYWYAYRQSLFDSIAHWSSTVHLWNTFLIALFYLTLCDFIYWLVDHNTWASLALTSHVECNSSVSIFNTPIWFIGMLLCIWLSFLRVLSLKASFIQFNLLLT